MDSRKSGDKRGAGIFPLGNGGFMRLESLESQLSAVSQPILTLYIEAKPKDAASRGGTVSSLPWLRKEGKSLEAGLRREKRAAFRLQLERVERFLRNAATGYGAMAIFSSPAKWVQVPLPFAVSNEMHWGRPDLTQLRRIAVEQQSACIVAVDRAGARFYRYELGDLAELPAMKFEIDISQWRRKEHGHMARRDTKMPHGPLRDAFKKRLDQQYAHFFKHVSERIKFVCARDKLEVVLLVGSRRLTKPIESALPRELQRRVVLVGEDLAKIPPDKLQSRIQPRITAWMNQFAEQEAIKLLESRSGAVIGLDETLAELQNGRIGSMVMIRGLDAALRRCVNCGDISRSADPSCAVCGGARMEVLLSAVIDHLAREHHTRIEVLDPAAAKKLAKAGGIGGWLREPTLVAAR